MTAHRFHPRARRPSSRRRAAPISSSSAAAPPASPRRSPGARNGPLGDAVERYPYLGGLASGGMVLVLDDMCNGDEISVRGLCGETDRAHGGDGPVRRRRPKPSGARTPRCGANGRAGASSTSTRT